ncbi:AMP-binding protein [Shimia sp.]|uniref:AMP-binding protein n=1 Tax=Shimia sp. TaxID=1954381 RepID=UPI0032989091
MPLSAPLATHARQRPQALAVCVSGQSLTYQELVRQVSGLDRWAQVQPATPQPGVSLPPQGRLIATSLGNHPSAAVVLATGMATHHGVMVMDPSWPATQLADMLTLPRPDVLVALSHQNRLIAQANTLGIPICLADLALPEPCDFHPTTPDPQGTFLVGFTSGTTARPKAFARNRHSWQASLRAGKPVFDLDPSTHTLAPGPLSHGLTLYAFAETLDAGASFYGLDHFDAFAASHLMHTQPVRRLVAVPSMIQTIATRGPFADMTNVTTAGSKLDAHRLTELRSAFPAATIHEYYGASELGFVSVAHHAQTGSSAPPHSVGHPFAHVDMRMMQDGSDVEPGQDGTIFVRGDLAIAGYLSGGRNSGFRRQGDWATVGDIGRQNDDGSLTLLGREGGMVLSGGFNVYPQEVAAHLTNCPGVDSAVVLSQPDRARGQVLAAVILPAPDFKPQNLHNHIARHLPRYKTPRAFYTVAAWPRTQSGKIAQATLETWLTESDPRLAPLEPAR